MSELTYITSARCGWCRKADPIIEELQNSGIDITVLDVTEEDAKERAREIKSKFGVNCGTPLFIDAESGNYQCGMSEENIRKWAAGEKITPKKKPPHPNKVKRDAERRGGKLPKNAISKDREKIVLDEKAKIEILDNDQRWWSPIATLRSLRDVQKGFITRIYDWIQFPVQAKHMSQHGENYIVAASGDMLLGYARCIDGDIGICVYPELQGRGIASMLLEELLRRFPDAHARVKVDNESSKKLFEKFGFTVTDVVDVDCLHGIIFEKVMVMNRETQSV